MLAIFAEILHGPQGHLRAVEIVGRGISAEVRCTLATLADKRDNLARSEEAAIQESLSYAERLIELGEIEDSLVDIWQRRRADGLDDRAFELALEGIVNRLEEWPLERG
ncbi:hypothetical protein KRMM14A1004_00630 [Krasilnikovia sp. MM14-A1004]